MKERCKCGEPIKYIGYGRPPFYCGQCAKTERIKKCKGYSAKRFVKKNVNCKRCNKLLPEGTHGNTKYCDDCVKLENLENNRIYGKVKRKKRIWDKIHKRHYKKDEIIRDWLDVRS